MGALIGLFCIMAVVGSAIAIWLNTKFGKSGWKVCDMDFIIMFFLVGAIIAAGIAIWLNTKSGKKWLASL